MNFWRHTWLVIWLVCCGICVAQDDRPREWTSDTGSTVRATLVDSETVTIYVLRREDGTKVRVPANRLSPESRTLAESLLRRQRQEGGQGGARAADGAVKVREPQPANDDAQRDAPGKPVVVEKIKLPAPSTFVDLSQPVTSVTFSPTGRHLFLLYDRPYPRRTDKASLWDVASWRRMQPTSPECDYFAGPAVFSPDGRFLACQDGELIRIWRVKADGVSLVNTVASSHTTDVPVWLDDGTLVAKSPKRGIQFLRQDEAKGAVRFAILGEQDLASPGGIISGGMMPAGMPGAMPAGMPKVMSGGNPMPGYGGMDALYDEATPLVWEDGSVVVSPTGDFFATRAGVLSLWKIPSGKLLTRLDTPSGMGSYCGDAVVSPDGKWVGASGEPSWGTLWQISSPETRIDLNVSDTNPETIGTIKWFRLRCFSPDAKKVATSERILVQTAAGQKTKRLVAVWDTATGKHLFQFEASGTGKVFFSPNGNTLVAGGRTPEGEESTDYADGTLPHTIEVRDANNGDPRFHVTDVGISTIAFAPDGKTLLACYSRNNRTFMGERAMPIRFWEVKDAK